MKINNSSNTKNPLIAPINFLQKNFVAWLSGLKYFISIASNSAISWTNHLTGLLIDLAWNNTNSIGKIFAGNITRLYIGGNGTNNLSVGQYNYLANNTDNGSNNSMYGTFNFVNVEHAINEGIGSVNTVGIGSGFAGYNTNLLIATDNIVGTSHNGGLTNTAIAGRFRIVNDNTSTETIIPESYIIQGSIRNMGANVLDKLRGISFNNWVNDATVNKSAVIYADSSVDVGTSSRYFIQSFSQSPSVFAGDIEITDYNKNLILRSPNGKRWKIKVDNVGAISTEEIISYND